MEFRISDTFTSSLARLTGDEQKSVKTTAFDLQMNPANPGLNFHKLDKAKDKNFSSVRVNRDIRLIVHRTEGSLLLCYVDHHDKAYEWAERRKFEIHPKTGAAQLVEIRETVQEVMIPLYVEQLVKSPSAKKLFESIPDDTLLGYGIPADWLTDVREATEDTLFSLADHLPTEAAEALLELATGGKPVISSSPKTVDPFKHPDAERRFRTLRNTEELERALNYPWDKWAVFLHPEQLQIVQKSFSGPARVSGSAGTGKTIVALHRAVFLARKNPDSRVLLTTFSQILANVLRNLLRKLVSNEPQLAERIDVTPINDLGVRMYKANFATPHIISKDELLNIITEISGAITNNPFPLAFLQAEWEQVVDTWYLQTWEEYRDVKRLGRKTRLPEAQRALLWSIFEKVNKRLNETDKLTYSMLFHQLTELVQKKKKFPFDFVVVDEAQDISVSQLHFFAALSSNNPNALFFAGDTGQRIFQQVFSWKAVGVDIRGRSKTLHVNYRTSHQIRQQADLLLGPDVTDADGNIEERNRTISLFNGPKPSIQTFETKEAECNKVSSWIESQLQQGIAPHEVGIFIRSEDEVPRALDAVSKLKVPYIILDEKVETLSGAIAVSTMHYAKGLEFKSVIVMACDDEVIPSQKRIEGITDNADLEDVYNTERHLLYVACTRARDSLLVTSVQPASEFLEDLLL
jgi:mRNA-degrading endonuclease RelE of RelBE toxin-antitoxin system